MTQTLSDPAAPGRDGRVITFYSYKGGTGRTMALANVAWILASSGHRVLVADWDLESPGLHRFFHPFLGDHAVRDASGIVDLIRDYERAARAAGPGRVERLIPQHARVQPYALSLDWEFAGQGGLDFLSPGRQNRDYATTLVALDWDNFYERLNGSEFLDAVRSDMKWHYDYVLIDSRTGLSDIADICTVQFPDVLVDCFTLSTQGIEGAAEVARLIQRRHQNRGIRILPVPMRVDPAEQEKVEAGRAVAARHFEGLPAAMSPDERQEYWAAVEVPYRAYFAYEETLAVFADAPGSPMSLLASFERLAAQITDGKVTGLPRMDDQLRERTRRKFTRQLPREEDEILVEFAAEDQVWAEWIASILHGTGVVVRERRYDDRGDPASTDDPARRVTVISAASMNRRHRPSAARGDDEVAVYVSAIRPLLEFSGAASVFLADVPEKEASDRLLRLLSLPRPAAVSEDEMPARTRYPGNQPQVDRSPARNTRFTGRENDLRDLRDQLRDYGKAVVLPVTLQGLGGVGKTQVAIEYVHRFKSDYDLVWWLECGQPAFIDASLADLWARVQELDGITVPVTAIVEESARSVLQLLESGRSALRWLLIYDNAEDIDAIKPYLPTGNGHMLITSRNRAWSDQARSLPIEVFTRGESIAHLCQRAPSVSPEQADQVAEALGDLPLAVATAGAWLAETGFTVSDYLEELKLQPSRTLSMGERQADDYPQPVSRTWDLSLNRLEEQSPAAARFFELCSVMAPRIAVDLLYSPAMAGVLKPFDSALAERMIIGRIVQEINRLALIKLDTAEGRVHVHRLVQAVVRDRMSPAEMASARRDVQQVLAAARPRRDVDDPDTWPRFRLIWPHLEPSEAMTSREESVRALFIDRVRYLWQRHDLDRARQVATEVEAAWEEMLAAQQLPEEVRASLRVQLLHLRFNLGNVLRYQTRYEDAMALDESVLAQQRELLGPDHPHTLMTAGGLAADLRALGRYRDALKMDEVTYPAWTELYGDDHSRTLSAAHNLAESYRLSGDITQALKFDEDTLRRRRSTLGPQHPRTLDSASSVARDLLEAGRYGPAADVMDSVLKSVTEGPSPDLGPDPVAALNAQVLLGIAQRSVGHPELAEPNFREAASGLTRRFGRDGFETLACRMSQAVNALALGLAADAEQEIREVRDRSIERLGASHPHSLVARVNLAAALRDLGRPAEALQEAQAADEGLTDMLGDEHPYTLAARVSVGVLLADQGDAEAAELLQTRTTDTLAHVLGRDHPDVLGSRSNLLMTRLQLGVPRIVAERNQGIDQLATLIGAEHPQIRELRLEHPLMRALDPQPF